MVMAERVIDPNAESFVLLFVVDFERVWVLRATVVEPDSAGRARSHYTLFSPQSPAFPR